MIIDPFSTGSASCSVLLKCEIHKTSVSLSDCGAISVPEPRHAGELLSVCPAEELLQGRLQILHHHSGIETSGRDFLLINISAQTVGTAKMLHKQMQ